MAIKNVLTKRNAHRLVLALVPVIFLILPFTTPLSVFLGSQLNQLDIFKVWKEIAMVLVAVLILLSGTHKRLARVKERGFKILLWLIVAYSLWTLMLGLINLALDNVNWEAFIYAAIVNLRFLFFFLLCWVVTQDSERLKTEWNKLVLAPAVIVVTFGLLQAWVLPPNVLEHVGYGPDTITAYQTVDQHPEYVRVQSTLRGPNPLGAYLVIIIAALLIGLRRKWWPQIALLAGSFILLFYTYSRSAWLGVAIALVAWAFVSIKSSRTRRNLVVAGVAAVLLFAGIIYAARDNQFVQKTVFHSDETSLSPQSSNEQRAGALQAGIDDVVSEPLGRGPGSAGPASLRNDRPERIAENYYLQIGQEVGLIGLLIFLAINVQISILLWQRRSNLLAKVLLASLAGITLVNLLSHAWTDETLSLLWWGLAGLCLAIVLPKTAPSVLKQPNR